MESTSFRRAPLRSDRGLGIDHFPSMVGEQFHRMQKGEGGSSPAPWIDHGEQSFSIAAFVEVVDPAHQGFKTDLGPLYIKAGLPSLNDLFCLLAKELDLFPYLVQLHFGLFLHAAQCLAPETFQVVWTNERTAYVVCVRKGGGGLRDLVPVNRILQGRFVFGH